MHDLFVLKPCSALSQKSEEPEDSELEETTRELLLQVEQLRIRGVSRTTGRSSCSSLQMRPLGLSLGVQKRAEIVFVKFQVGRDPSGGGTERGATQGRQETPPAPQERQVRKHRKQ